MKNTVLVLVLLMSCSMAFAGDLIVSTAVTISAPAGYDYVSVQAGGALTANAPVTVLNNTTIQSGGVVTHSPHS